MTGATLLGRSITRTSDLDAASLRAVLDLAVELKADPVPAAAPLSGRVVGMIFERPSTRTRISFEAGVAQLGGHPMVIDRGQTQQARGEPIRDTAYMLGRYVDAVVLRAARQATLDEFARWLGIPIVNGLTDEDHPCQALAELLTLRERFGRLEGLRVGWLGDGNNVCVALMLGAALAGVAVRVASPAGYAPAAEVVARARALGGDVEVGDDPAWAADGAHALVTDVWASMGQEDEAAQRRAAFAGFSLDAAALARARPGAVAMHCLPAHVGEEIAADVLYGPSSAVWDEAENRLHTQKALLSLVLGPPAGA